MAASPLLEPFLKHLSVERGLSPRTRAAYASDLKDFERWLALRKREPLGATGDVIGEYLWHLSRAKKLKPASLFRRMESLKSFFRWLVYDERLAKDPTLALKSPRLPERFPRFLAAEPMERLLHAAGEEAGGSPEDGFRALRLKAMLELLYATGMRVSELTGLRLDSVHLDQGWVRVTGKGNKERMIPFHPRAKTALVRYLHARETRFGEKAGAQVFVGRSGKALGRVQVWKELNGLARKAGIGKIHPHLLRHTFASHLIQHGADLRSVQEMLGHADLSSTQIYTHLERSGIKSSHQKSHPRG